ncbi:MAG: hypothetical protein L6U16_10990 [Porphyromonadaceae bacterium]|nr:MAG: hypothetical protein L6U16_10990 [Porphyromonadaceae bacterium]
MVFLQAKATEENPSNCKEKDFDKWLKDRGCTKSMKWVKMIKGVVQPAVQTTLETYIRNYSSSRERTKPKIFKSRIKKIL